MRLYSTKARVPFLSAFPPIVSENALVREGRRGRLFQWNISSRYRLSAGVGESKRNSDALFNKRCPPLDDEGNLGALFVLLDGDTALKVEIRLRRTFRHTSVIATFVENKE